MDARRSGGVIGPLVGLALALGAMIAVIGIASSGDRGQAKPPTTEAAGPDPYDCHPSDTGQALLLRGSVTSPIDLATSDESVSIQVGRWMYLATPIGASKTAALVVAYPPGSPNEMVAVNGLAKSHTELPYGGEQDGIDAALSCLPG